MLYGIAWRRLAWIFFSMLHLSCRCLLCVIKKCRDTAYWKLSCGEWGGGGEGGGGENNEPVLH